MNGSETGRANFRKPDLLRSVEPVSDMSLALIAPGQGGQKIGMGTLLAAKSDRAAVVWQVAGDIFGGKLIDLVREGPSEELSRTINAQPAIVTDTIARFEALKEMDVPVNAGIQTGSSFGFYAALYTSGAVDLEDTFRLVKARAEATQAACDEAPSSMAAFIRVPDEIMDEAAKRYELELCLDNTPMQKVLGGAREKIAQAITWVEEQHEARGSKVIRLDVSGAFHCSFMRSAVPRLRSSLESVQFDLPSSQRLVGISQARFLTTIQEIKTELLDQLTSTVQWQQVSHLLRNSRVATVIELNEKSRFINLSQEVIGGDREEILWSKGDIHEPIPVAYALKLPA